MQNPESKVEGRAWRTRTVQRSGRRRGKCQGGLGVTVWGPRSQGKKCFQKGGVTM